MNLQKTNIQKPLMITRLKLFCLFLERNIPKLITLKFFLESILRKSLNANEKKKKNSNDKMTK